MKDLNILLKRAFNIVGSNSPTILSGLAVGGVFTSVILAIKATPTAIMLIDEEKYSRQSDQDLTYKDIIRLTWKLYIPTVLSSAATIGCIIASNSISLRRNAAIGALYSLSEISLKEYQDKIVELIGKTKEEKIRDDISQDHLLADPVNPSKIISTGNGSSLFYDALTGRYFRSDINTVRRLENEFNKELIDEMYKSLNDFYYLLDLPPTILGRDVGWDANRGLLDIHFTSKIATNDEPCVVLEYKVLPRKI